MKALSFIRNGSVLLVFVGYSFSAVAQRADSIQSQSHSQNWRKVVGIPIVFVTAGLIATTDNEVFDKFEVYEDRNRLAPHFKTHIDDFMQYSPIAAVYALDAFGIKGVHDVVNQTALIVKTEIIMTAMVEPLKTITAVPRPDTGERNSFPSGHTAQAFAAATIVHKEYGKEHPVYSVLAYTAATGVGVLRILNNRHWMSDVLAGAGIGILAANLAYFTHQNKWGKKFSKRGIVLAPSYGSHTFSLCAVISIK